MLENYQLRDKARADLGGHIFKRNWQMMLVLCVVSDICLAVATYTGIGYILVAGAFAYGLMRLSMNLVQHKPISFNMLFDGFNECFFDALLLNFLMGLFSFLWGLLFIIPGIVKQYSYAMAPYIQQRQENKDWHHAMNESKRLMNGFKSQLFWLDMSFIGWYLLGIITFGIGLLFVVPYHMVARAEFFEARIVMDEGPVATERTIISDGGGEFKI